MTGISSLHCADWPQVVRSALLGVTLCSTIACGDPLEVDAPDLVRPEDLVNRDGAAVMRAGAIGRFVFAFNGTHADGRGLVGMTALMTDEFTSALRTNNTSDDAADRRRVLDPGLSSPYTQMQEAYVSLLLATGAYKEILPSGNTEIAELHALTGYMLAFFGEVFCSGVPLSTVRDRKVETGEPVPTQNMYNSALSHFDSALTYAGPTATTAASQLARVGRARVLADLGRFAEAATAAASVPPAFVYVTGQSASLQQNGVYLRMYSNRYWSVSDREGGNGLDFLSARDPRVPSQLVGASTNDGVTPVYGFNAYASGAAPIVVASGTEARLIVAEAALRNNEPTAALDILNDLRRGIAGLAPLSLANTPQERVLQLFRERAFWLYATAHRLGDLRRLVRQYDFAVGQVFPTGTYGDLASSYGDAVTFTPSSGELNNPRYTGCLDRNP